MPADADNDALNLPYLISMKLDTQVAKYRRFDAWKFHLAMLSINELQPIKINSLGMFI